METRTPDRELPAPGNAPAVADDEQLAYEVAAMETTTHDRELPAPGNAPAVADDEQLADEVAAMEMDTTMSDRELPAPGNPNVAGDAQFAAELAAEESKPPPRVLRTRKPKVVISPTPEPVKKKPAPKKKRETRRMIRRRAQSEEKPEEKKPTKTFTVPLRPQGDHWRKCCLACGPDTLPREVKKEDLDDKEEAIEQSGEEKKEEGAQPNAVEQKEAEDSGVAMGVIKVEQKDPEEKDEEAVPYGVEKMEIDEDESMITSEQKDSKEKEGHVEAGVTFKKEQADEAGGDVPVQNGPTDDDLIKCAIKNCTQMMHKKCAEGYVCSEYTPAQAQLLFRESGPVCTAHFCWHCYDERHKHASRMGQLIDCDKCMRSFHVECLPAGCSITGERNTPNGKRKTFTCHFHAPAVHLTQTSRLKYCIDCEEEEFSKGEVGKAQDPKDPERRMTCKNCTNVFHKKCSFDEIKGPDAWRYEDMCSNCVIGGTIVPDQYVLAYYPYSCNGLPPGTYPGIALSATDPSIPDHVKRKWGKKLGQVGWIPVKWIWYDEEGKSDKSFFDIVPKSKVQRVTIGCEKNLPTDEFIAELKSVEHKWKAPTRPLDYDVFLRDVKIINENIYQKGQKRTEDQDTMVCSCKPNAEGIKCDTSDCENRQCNAECPKSCDSEDGVKCENRVMQRKEERRKVKYEVKEAPNGKGLGVFATQLIKPLELIFEYVGEVIDLNEKIIREKRMAELRSHDESTYIMGLKFGYFVDARWKGGKARFANHSCDPNAEVQTVDVWSSRKNSEKSNYIPKIKLTALRTIREGEEITFDYGLAKSDGLALDNCSCLAANCTGKIGKEKPDDKNKIYNPMLLIRQAEKEAEEEERRRRRSVEEEDDKENKDKKKKAQAKATPKKSAKATPKMTVKEEENLTMTAKKRRASKAFDNLPSTSQDNVPAKKSE